MLFHKYPSIINSFKGDEIDYIKINHAKELADVTWHVYEKVHGANFSMWTDGKDAEFAKRTGFLKPDDKFFNYQLIANKYLTNLITLHNLVGKPVVVFGELFGGGYNGTTDKESVKVQKEVQYCPHNEFVAFDMALIGTGHISFMDEAEFHDLAMAAGFSVPPYFGEFDTLEEALAYKNEFITQVPNKWSLVEIPNNFAEGVVIKPSKNIYMHTGQRVVFKNKNPLFKEEEAVEIQSCTTQEFMKFYKELESKITKNRFINVLSKEGRDKPIKEYFSLFLTDALDDCAIVPYQSFNEAQKRLLNRLVSRNIWPIIKDELEPKKVICA